MRISVLLIGFICLLAGPASAAPAINDAGAAALKTHIQDILTRQKNARAFAGGSLISEGDILVEQADGYYAVTLPDLTVTDAKGQRTDLGIIAINATPDEKPGNWKLSLSIPSPITWTDAAGTPLGKLTLGTQRLSGIWNESLSGFTTLDAGYDDIRIDDLPTKTTQTIASATIKSAMKETAPDIWAGEAVVSFSKLASSSTAHTGAANADAVTLNVKIAGLSAAKQKEMREKLSAFKENTDPKDLESMSPAGQMALYNMLVDVLRSAGDSASISASVNNLSMTMPAVAKQTARSIALKSGTFGLAMQGMGKGNVTLALKSIMQGFVSTPEAPDATGMTPSDMDIDLKLENLPFDELVLAGRDILKNAGSGPAARQFAGIQAMMVLPKILSQAGAQVTVTQSTLTSPSYDVKMDGTMRADATASAGAVGKIKAEIAGLDGLITQLQGRIASAGPLEKAKLQKLVQTLTVMNLAGQAEKRGDKTVKVYDFELGKEGQMLLNGSDLSILTGGAVKAPEAAPAPTVEKPAAR